MGGEAGASGGVAYDLAKGKKASPVLFWVLAGVILIAAAGAIYALVFNDDPAPTPEDEIVNGRRHQLTRLGVELIVPPGAVVSPEGATAEVLVPAEASGTEESSVLVTFAAAEGSAARLAADYRSQEAPGWKDAGVFSLLRKRRLRRGDATELHEILWGPRPSLLESVPDNARGAVDHRLWVESPEGEVVMVSWRTPEQSPDALEDRLEAMITSIRFLR